MYQPGLTARPKVLHSHRFKKYILPTFYKNIYIGEVVSIRSIIIFRTSKLWNTGEAAGEIWHWSLLGVKGLPVASLKLAQLGART